jgi:hypothetical protein
LVLGAKLSSFFQCFSSNTRAPLTAVYVAETYIMRG